MLGLQKDAEYNCGEIKLNENDLILYYTDGVIDSSNYLGERFDEQRLIKIHKIMQAILYITRNLK